MDVGNEEGRTEARVRDGADGQARRTRARGLGNARDDMERRRAGGRGEDALCDVGEMLLHTPVWRRRTTSETGTGKWT